MHTDYKNITVLEAVKVLVDEYEDVQICKECAEKEEK